jgi:type VI secretion system protein ImpI/type VI secretion system protein
LPSDEKSESHKAAMDNVIPQNDPQTNKNGNEKDTDFDVEPQPYLLSKSQIELFKTFLNAAGITDENSIRTEDIPNCMKTAGHIFRELVDGLKSLIKARAESRNQLRLEGTLLEATDNNPLKFDLNLDETLKILLIGKQKGFLSGVNAVKESYADIKSHQLAMTVGIQAALKKVLERFNPESYIQRYAKEIFFLRKTKCWDTYCEEYQDKVIESLENFLDEEFANAYEKQIAKLNNPTDDH